MRDFVRPVAAAFGIAGLAVAISVASNTDVFAQAKQQQMAPAPKQAPAAPPQADQAPAIKQIALTDKQIESVLSAQKDMDAITDKIRTTPRRIPRSTPSSTTSPRNTASPTIPTTTPWSTISAWCSAASIPRPRSM